MSHHPQRYYDVFVVGDYCLDFIFSGLRELPQLGSEIEAPDFSISPGGTCNAVITMHRLGLNVGWCADFGKDQLSRLILDHLISEEVPTDLFEYHDYPFRNITVSLSFPSDRAFVAYYDKKKSYFSVLKHLPNLHAKLMYIPGLFYGPELHIGKNFISKKNMVLFMDGNTNKNETLAMHTVKKAIQSVDIISMNAKEACQMTKKGNIVEASYEIAELCNHVIIKDGERGAIANWEGNLLTSRAINVNAIDTTGAGDCFNSGFIKAYLSGHTIQDCLNWGNIVGGLSTEKLGGVGRHIREQDVLARLTK